VSLQVTARCWHQEAGRRPPFGEISETLQVMAHEFPVQETVTQQASTGKAVARDFPCQLRKDLVDALEGEQLLTRGPGGVRHCTLNLRRPLSPTQGLLRAAAVEHVGRASPGAATVLGRSHAPVRPASKPRWRRV
jgi:hypothetical protein